MITISPSPIVDYVAFALTGLVILLGVALAWYVDRREGERLGWRPVGLPVPSRRTLVAMREWPLLDAWPPALAVVAGVAVFTAILLTTPPGAQALVDLFRENPDERAQSAAYGIGAAASLGLTTLLAVAALGEIASRLAHLRGSNR